MQAFCVIDKRVELVRCCDNVDVPRLCRQTMRVENSRLLTTLLERVENRLIVNS